MPAGELESTLVSFAGDGEDGIPPRILASIVSADLVLPAATFPVSDSPSAELVELDRRLAGVAGCSVTRQETLARHTTLRIGGPADLLVRIRSEAALSEVLAISNRQEVPFLILGLGSNVLIPDEGIPGVVAILEGDLQQFRIDGVSVEAGAGLPLSRLAQVTVEKGLAGLEALGGFPSTVGGAVMMNAGCYGVEIKDVLESATIVHPDGAREILTPDDLGAGYRTTRLQGGRAVVVRAVFRLRESDPTAVRGRLLEVNRRRRQSMPGGRPNAGSVFRNPPGDHAGRLIDLCGLRGTQQGGAQISPEHANVIVNLGHARAEDVLALMVEMRQKVANRFGIDLKPELVLAGDLAARWEFVSGERTEN